MGTIDALLMQLCGRYELTLLSSDQDFALAAPYVPFKLWSNGGGRHPAFALTHWSLRREAPGTRARAWWCAIDLPPVAVPVIRQESWV